MASSYPVSIKTWQTFVDYQDINYAENLNEVHDEILAIEQTLGTNPFSGLPTTYTGLNAALTDLYQNKAPAAHTHLHSALQGDSTGDDHPQYALLSGAVFTGPVTAPPAVSSGQLATLAQLQSAGLANQSAVQGEINAALASQCKGAPSGSVPLVGRSAGTGWVLTGGYNEGCTGSAPAGPDYLSVRRRFHQLRAGVCSHQGWRRIGQQPSSQQLLSLHPLHARVGRDRGSGLLSDWRYRAVQ